MAFQLIKIILTISIIISTLGCSSRHNGEEVACNFVSGATDNEYDHDSSASDDFISDILTGLFNMAWQSAHRSVSYDSYDSCVKKDVATCIDSNGNIKKECMLTK